jgi:HSP20 family protein
MRIARYRDALPDVAYRPFDVQNRIQRMFSDLLTPTAAEGLSWTPAIDVFELDTELVLRADLPGMRKEDVVLEINDNMLVLKGEKKEEKEEKKAEYRLIERSWGAFERTFSLPSSVDVTKIHADFRNGVLEVHLPKTAKSTGRKVEIAEK